MCPARPSLSPPRATFRAKWNRRGHSRTPRRRLAIPGADRPPALSAALAGLLLLLLTTQIQTAPPQVAVASALPFLDLPLGAHEVSALAWHPDGRLLAGAFWREPPRDATGKTLAPGTHSVALLDTETGELRRILRGHTARIGVLAFSPGGRSLLSGSRRELYQWDLRTGRRERTFRGHSGAACLLGGDLATGMLAASSPCGREMGFWDFTTGQLKRRVAGQAGVTHLSSGSPGSGVLATGTPSEVSLWDAAVPRLLQTFRIDRGWLCQLALSSDGRALALGKEDGAVEVWDVRTARLARRLPGDGNVVTALAFTPAGGLRGPGPRLWLANAHCLLSPYGDQGEIQIWDLATGAPRERLRGHAALVSCLAFSPDGRVLAGGASDGAFRLWRIGG